MERLIFHNHPTVELATNTFVRVPVILQYDELPLIEIVQTQSAGFTTKIPIYHPDGTYLAKVVGSHLFPTPEGEQAGLRLEHPDRMTVCKLGEKVLFEIRRKDAAALRTQAELYTPDGRFVKCAQSSTPKLYTRVSGRTETKTYGSAADMLVFQILTGWKSFGKGRSSQATDRDDHFPKRVSQDEQG